MKILDTYMVRDWQPKKKTSRKDAKTQRKTEE
jgi:hypothetical protein